MFKNNEVSIHVTFLFRTIFKMECGLYFLVLAIANWVSFFLIYGEVYSDANVGF